MTPGQPRASCAVAAFFVMPRSIQPVYSAGDLLFFSGRGFYSRLIKGFTCSPLQWFRPCWGCVSHVGIISDWHGANFLFESTTLCDEPCEITGQMRDGMQAHRPGPRVNADGGFVFHAKPNIDRSQFTAGHVKALRIWLGRQMAASYDYLGAAESAIHSNNANLSRVFCSEVVAGALMEIGRLPLDNPARYTPSFLVQELVRIGTYLKPARIK
jgi:hypothetical protein